MQQTATTRDARHHRADRDAKPARNVRVAQFLDIAQPYGVPKRFGHRLEGRLEARPDDFSQQPVLG